jgi:hypothetical protein
MLVVQLHELDGKRLKNYGQISDHLIHRVDQLTYELEASLKEILAISGTNPSQGRIREEKNETTA